MFVFTFANNDFLVHYKKTNFEKNFSIFYSKLFVKKLILLRKQTITEKKRKRSLDDCICIFYMNVEIQARKEKE